MLQIGNTVISLDIIEKKFICDLPKCMGSCCVHGDSGAPLEESEVTVLKQIYNKVMPFMQASGIESVNTQGTSVIDSDGDKVTPLINGKECAYTYFEKGVALCAIEKAYYSGQVAFRKPISCHLYPVRVSKYGDVTLVNYHRWDICNDAILKGKKESVPVYVFLKEALITKFGNDWYNELEIAANELKSQSE